MPSCYKEANAVADALTNFEFNNPLKCIYCN